ncbi:hypothetical protein [Spongiactinospora rosea]|nr:hypothetical protein [Spongiactinospora rosea]
MSQPTSHAPRTASSFSHVRGPLDAAEDAFRLLMQGPQSLGIDGAHLGAGLPARVIALEELRAILLHPSCGRVTRDEVWRHLIGQARVRRGAWMVAAVALAMPMLRRLATSICRSADAERDDVEAEVLTGFMDALSKVNLQWTHPLLRLSRLTRRSVARSGVLQRPCLLNDAETAEGHTLAYPSGHADLLLAKAVTQGIITAEAAEIIAVTRLENIPLSDYCRRRGLLYCTILKRRQRAEARLRQAIVNGDLTGGDL